MTKIGDAPRRIPTFAIHRAHRAPALPERANSPRATAIVPLARETQNTIKRTEPSVRTPHKDAGLPMLPLLDHLHAQGETEVAGDPGDRQLQLHQGGDGDRQVCGHHKLRGNPVDRVPFRLVVGGLFR